MSDINECFISGHKNSLVETDYSQLETRLIAGIQCDIDIHCVNAANMYNDTYQRVQRICKDPSHPDYSMWIQRRQIAKARALLSSYGLSPSLLE